MPAIKFSADSTTTANTVSPEVELIGHMNLSIEENTADFDGTIVLEQFSDHTTWLTAEVINAASFDDSQIRVFPGFSGLKYKYRFRLVTAPTSPGQATVILNGSSNYTGSPF